jgi:hypothetical protein
VTSAAEAAGAFRRARNVADVVDDVSGGRVVLLHLPSGRRRVLSDTATAVWQAVVAAGPAGARVADLAPPLAAQFGADPEVVERDVAQLMGELLAADVVELVSGGQEPRPSGAAG